MANDLLQEVKNACMVGHSTDDTINDELAMLIEGAKVELKLAGAIVPAKNEDITDSLTRTAIIFFCKANFSFDNPDSDRYERRFVDLKILLSGLALEGGSYALD